LQQGYQQFPGQYFQYQQPVMAPAPAQNSVPAQVAPKKRKKKKNQAPGVLGQTGTTNVAGPLPQQVTFPAPV
jgi:hypothetical protein